MISAGTTAPGQPISVAASPTRLAGRSLAVGPAALGVLTLALYLIGSGRTYGYDAAVTFAHFIATDSVWDPFGRSSYFGFPASALAGNNHLLLSFLEHVVFSLSGTRSEAIYRLLPAAAAGAAVAITSAALVRRFGRTAGISAGLFMAANPLFAEQSRDLRGYSLMTLFAVVSTLALLRLTAGSGRPPVWLAAGYVVTAALGVMSQPYTGLVLAAHAALLVQRGGPRLLMRLGPLVVVSAGLGLATYAGLVPALRGEAMEQGRRYTADFALLTVLFLFGAPYLLVVGLWLAAAGLGLVASLRERSVLLIFAVALVAVGFVWLVLQPSLLYPRFFVFLVPGCAYLLAAAIHRWVVLAPIVVLGAGLALWYEVPSFTQDPLAERAAAQELQQAATRGDRGCIINKDQEIVRAYTTAFHVIRSPAELSSCDVVVVVSWNVDLPTRDRAAADFPYARRYPAWYPTVVLSRHPLDASPR